MSNSTDLRLFESTNRYFIITSTGNRMLLSRSDLLGRVSCHATVNGRGVTVTTETIEMEASQVSLALTPSDASRLAGALRAAMDAVQPPHH